MYLIPTLSTLPYQKSLTVAKIQQLNCISSAANDWNLMIFFLLDSSLSGASNRSIYMSFGLIDKKLFAKVYKQQISNNFSSANPNDMIYCRMMRLVMTNLIKKRSLNFNHWLLKRRDICKCQN